MKRFKGYRVKVDPKAGQNVTMKGHKLTVGPGLEPFLENPQALKTIIVRGTLESIGTISVDIVKYAGPFMQVFTALDQHNENKPEPGIIRGNWPLSESDWLRATGHIIPRYGAGIFGLPKDTVVKPIQFEFHRGDMARQWEKIREELTKASNKLTEAMQAENNKRMNRKKFNLADALAGKKVITDTGATVEQIRAFAGVNGKYNNFGVCNGSVINFDAEGRHPGYCAPTLYMALEKKTGFVNVYKEKEQPCHAFSKQAPYTKTGAGIWPTREEAVKQIKNEGLYVHIATVPIEWYE